MVFLWFGGWTLGVIVLLAIGWFTVRHFAVRRNVMTELDHVAAHEHSTNHREELKRRQQ
jgi:hypothetical protein